MGLVFIETLKGHRLTLALMMLGLALLALIIPATYQAIGGPSINQMMESLPSSFQAFIKAQGGSLLTSGAQGYIAVGFRHPVVLVIGAAFAIASASSAVAGQVGRRTILLMLVRPVVRWQLLSTRIAETVTGLLLLVVASLAGTAIGLAVSGLAGVSFPRLIIAVVNAFALFAAISGYAYAISASTSEGGRAAGIATGLTALFFIMDFLAELWSPLGWMGPLSVFNYYDAIDAATGNIKMQIRYTRIFRTIMC